MSASQHNPDQRPTTEGSASAAPAARTEAFDAGRDRGIADGADWARHRAVTADLRQMCDQRDQQPLAIKELIALIERYRNDPRCLASAAGHDAEPYREGYGIGFQRGACSVWSKLRQLAAHLDRVF